MRSFENNISDAHGFTSEQVAWLDSRDVPTRIYIRTAAEFDDRYVDSSGERWVYRFSGRNHAIDFSKSIYFRKQSGYVIKLIKLLTKSYLSEYGGFIAPSVARELGKTFKQLSVYSHSTLISVLESTQDPKDQNTFYAVLYALRKLEGDGFFSSTDNGDDLEDKLLFVPRPLTSSWGIYSEIDNILPQSVADMIQNGLHEWAAKFAPKLESDQQKQSQLEYVRANVRSSALLDCIILGLVYSTGMRPAQLSKLAVGDIFIDTKSNQLTRFAIAVPYAKKTQVHIDRVFVAIPEELGKLTFLYQTLNQLEKGTPLLPQNTNADKVVNAAIARQLLRFSPLETQTLIVAGEIEAPSYNASIFRHHVGHTLAMSGASAEEISYILGHSNTVVANRYISATPNLADIREKALGSNPVFQNMIALMLTGNLIKSREWTGRKVAGHVGSRLHFHIGGCGYDEPICPFSEVRACYGCLYFRPFIDGEHHQVFDDFNNEIIDLIKISDEVGQPHHPLIPELTRRKSHVNTIMLRIKMLNTSKEQENA